MTQHALVLPSTGGTVYVPPAPPLYAFTAGEGSACGGGRPSTSSVSPATAARVTDPAARAAYWNSFYIRHGGRFFKDRHWLGREFGDVLRGAASVLEVGCGVGNAALMLLSDDDRPGRTVWACDFAPAGVELMVQRAHEMGLADRLRAFVADATVPGALVASSTHASSSRAPPPASLDAATLLFALSAMPPGEAMGTAVANVAAALKPGGFALVRDYCGGDLAQERLAGKKGGRRVEVAGTGDDGAGPPTSTSTGGLFMRGDGTLAYYFDGASELVALFTAAGFETHSAHVVEATKVNRASGASMPRRWVQGVFRWTGRGGAMMPAAAAPGRKAGRGGGRYKAEWERDAHSSSSSSSSEDAAAAAASSSTPSSPASSASSGAARAAARLLSGLGMTLPPLEPVTLDLPSPLGLLSILAAPGELRNTTGHTGLLVWGAAPAFARALLTAATRSGGSLPFLRSGPVLEVGCGSAPALSLASLSAGAPRYVATDGSPVALSLYARNFASHAWRVVSERGRVRRLAWGEDEEVERVVEENTHGGRGFSTVLGADVLYSAPAVPRLMATVRAALAKNPASVALFCLQVRGVSLERVVEAAGVEGLVPVALPAGLAEAAAAGGIGRPGDLLQVVAFGWDDV